MLCVYTRSKLSVETPRDNVGLKLHLYNYNYGCGILMHVTQTLRTKF